MDSLSGLTVFTKVAERESFTGAAKDLKISKSAVSKQIARLEDRLGVQLIHRTTRRLSLTEVGRAFYERAHRVVGCCGHPDGSLCRDRIDVCGGYHNQYDFAFCAVDYTWNCCG